jgi:hypothetical protein
MSHEQQIEVLKETIKWFRKEIQPHDCGWMYTTIDGLKHRIKILKNEMKEDLPKETWAQGYAKWKEEKCPHN